MPSSDIPVLRPPAAAQVGEFYEGCGIDAVLLVQHAGLNPMGQGGPPRAGCPRVNLRQTVNDLVRVGLSVVVCEEVRGTCGWERSMVASGGQAWWTATALWLWRRHVTAVHERMQAVRGLQMLQHCCLLIVV